MNRGCHSEMHHQFIMHPGGKAGSLARNIGSRGPTLQEDVQLGELEWDVGGIREYCRIEDVTWSELHYYYW